MSCTVRSTYRSGQCKCAIRGAPSSACGTNRWYTGNASTKDVHERLSSMQLPVQTCEAVLTEVTHPLRRVEGAAYAAIASTAPHLATSIVTEQ